MSEPKSKPFPWRCLHCRQRTIKPATVAYTAHVKHDGRVYDVDVPALRVPKCELCGELLFDNESDEQITRALREKLYLLQPEQIRSRREEIELTQRELSERIGVAQETISRWESGLVIQSRAMDNLLRLFLAFDEVRCALVGEGQDPRLGLEVCAAPARATSAREAVLRDLLEEAPEEKREEILELFAHTLRLVSEK